MNERCRDCDGTGIDPESWPPAICEACAGKDRPSGCAIVGVWLFVVPGVIWMLYAAGCLLRLWSP